MSDKKMRPRITNPDISFGPMVIGQEQYQHVKLQNSEAIGTALRYYLVDEKGEERRAVPKVAPRERGSGNSMSPRPEEVEEKEEEEEGEERERKTKKTSLLMVNPPLIPSS